MEIIKTGIHTRDAEFAKALAIGIARESSRMELKVATGAENEDFDLLLTDFKSDGENTVHLVSGPAPDLFRQNPPYSLYRYMDSREMANALLYLYFRMTGKIVAPRKKGRSRLLVIFSFSGGAGVTTTGISLAKMLYRLYGSRCLYFNLGPVNDSGLILGGGCKTGFLKLLYYLDINKDFPIDSFISETEEVDYLDTERFNPHYGEMNEILMGRFSEKADGLGRYDFIIADIGNHLGIEGRKLLEYADAALLILREGDGKSRICSGEFAQEMTEGEAAGNFLRIVNFAREYEENTEDFHISKAETLDLNENYGTEIGFIAKYIEEGMRDEV